MGDAGPGHVYVVCAELPPNVVGGLGRYAERMLRHLAAGAVPVDVFGVNAPVAGPRRARHGRLTVHRLAAARLRPRDGAHGPVQQLRLVARFVSFNARVAAHVVAMDRGRRGSVVAVHDWMGGMAGVLCRLLAGTRVVFHVHSNDMTVDTTWRGRSVVASGIAAIEGVQARLADRIVVPSSTMRAALVRRGWPANRIVVIPHGSDDPQLCAVLRRTAAERSRVRAQLRARYLHDGHGRLLVYAGRLSHKKGVPTLLEATALLAGRGHDLRLLLIGDASPNTDERAMVAGIVARLGLAGRVVAFHRFVAPAALYDHFVAADVCVFPSHYEPFGLAALEALALGRPVVLGPGFAPELVDAGGGLARRCATGSAADLADHLARALADGEQPDDPAPGRVIDTFTWARTAERTMRTYADALT